MALISADGRHLLVGDGLPMEAFHALKGASVKRLEITQRSNVSPAIAQDAWQVNTTTTARRVVIECDALATDATAALRVRDLALNGSAGNFKLELSATQTLQMSAVVTSYREIIEAGNIKQLQCRLESSGAPLLT